MQPGFLPLEEKTGEARDTTATTTAVSFIRTSDQQEQQDSIHQLSPVDVPVSNREQLTISSYWRKSEIIGCHKVRLKLDDDDLFDVVDN